MLSKALKVGIALRLGAYSTIVTVIIIIIIIIIVWISNKDIVGCYNFYNSFTQKETIHSKNI